jgi:Fe-S cluster assembly protein SufD
MKNNVIIIDKLDQQLQFAVGDNEKKTFVIFLGGSKSESGEVKIIIQGKHAYVKILGIILGFGEQKIELDTLQDHKAAESQSDLLIKSVLFDKAKMNYRGLIKIEKDAQKSNAYQKNQTILMSDKAWADTRPYLEILANDVRCTHGATLGKLDEEQLYYLKTRGIERKAATKLLIDGFLKDVLERIPDETAQRQLEEKISDKISRLLEE